MKYLCLVYLDADHWSACPDQVCADYAQQLADSMARFSTGFAARADALVAAFAAGAPTA